MVRFYEYQGKELLQKVGIPIPKGSVASTPQEARDYAKKLGRPVAVKAQIWATGRGKARGIKFADNPEGASNLAGGLIGSEIKGLDAGKSSTSFLTVLPTRQSLSLAMFSEIGTVQEEDAAEVIIDQGLKKPFMAYIAGAWAKAGMRFSHESAIMDGGKGTAENKIRSLKNAGVHVVNRPKEIAPNISRLLKR